MGVPYKMRLRRGNHIPSGKTVTANRAYCFMRSFILFFFLAPLSFDSFEAFRVSISFARNRKPTGNAIKPIESFVIMPHPMASARKIMVVSSGFEYHLRATKNEATNNMSARASLFTWMERKII